MAHSGALYSVRVRKKGRGHGEDYQPLGDINGAGAKLIVTLQGYLPELAVSSEDTFKDIRVDGHAQLVENGTELRITLRQGQRGVAADIYNSEGQLKAHQYPLDTNEVFCGALFRLPPGDTTGWLCAHVNNGRSVKGLLVEALVTRFREDFPELMLEVQPCALGAAVRQAVDSGRMDRVKLVKMERPRDRANPSTSKWVRADSGAQLVLDIKGWRGSHLLSDLVGRFLHGEINLFGEITEFEGMHFDEARIEVQLEAGQHRTFNLANPEAGHAITQKLEGLQFDDDGHPTKPTLFKALADVLDTLPR